MRCGSICMNASRSRIQVSLMYIAYCCKAASNLWEQRPFYHNNNIDNRFRGHPGTAVLPMCSIVYEISANAGSTNAFTRANQYGHSALYGWTRVTSFTQHSVCREKKLTHSFHYTILRCEYPIASSRIREPARWFEYGIISSTTSLSYNASLLPKSVRHARSNR